MAYTADREPNTAYIRICRIYVYIRVYARRWTWTEQSPDRRPGTAEHRRVPTGRTAGCCCQNKLRSKMLPATAKKLVMVHMWLKMKTMKESGKWEADLLEHTDEDLFWKQLTSLDEDAD